MREHGGHQHDAGQRADHDSGPKRAGHGNKRLLSRVARGSRCRHDGRGAQAGFVGEQAARRNCKATMMPLPTAPPNAAFG